MRNFRFEDEQKARHYYQLPVEMFDFVCDWSIIARSKMKLIRRLYGYYLTRL